MWAVPIISVVSARITVAPAPTKRSAAAPTAGFAVTPERASDPPHWRPTTSSLTGTGARSTFSSCSDSFRAMASPFSVVAWLPPDSWMTSASTGFPSAAPVRNSAFITSQPRPMISAAPTFGWFTSPVSVRWLTRKSSGP